MCVGGHGGIRKEARETGWCHRDFEDQEAEETEAKRTQEDQELQGARTKHQGHQAGATYQSSRKQAITRVCL